MNRNTYSHGLTRPQLALTLLLCLFSLVSIWVTLRNDGELFDLFYCIATIPFVCLPVVLSLLFHWKLNNLFYILFSFYALGPLLGAVYNIYYLTSWWDDLLHVLAGLIFAVCGTYLAHVLNRGKDVSPLLCLLFGLFFSLGIAVLWEIFEYASDVLLKSDMQADTVIQTVITKMGRTDGGVTVFEGIREVTVDGTPLGYGGYLDIGLIDTMQDMIVETLGALLYLVYALIDRERHPMIASCSAAANQQA